MRLRDQHKEALVKQKTMELLVREGLEGFSVNRIARECHISVRTLYIYYKDSDDLIVRIAKEEAKKMEEMLLDGFDASWSIEKGLEWMWKARAHYMLDNETSVRFLDLLRHSTYRKIIFGGTIQKFQKTMEAFLQNAIRNKEIDALPLEVFWSLAFSPLHSLIQLHNESQSTDKKFKLTNKLLDQTFKKMLKGLLH
ncbi:TetR/AcrR family transcriptional regulator [Chitinophaga sp. RCC_12]|uniref:TetR/AcrR family transcriptional regulator n=1 Tax=Chitinophaga sp. RCC_12 TaxID=3239226 RepID=UPI00352378B7